MRSDETVISAEEIGIWYKSGMRDDFRSWVLEALHGRKKRQKAVYAVEGVSFSAKAGEVLGIIGSNGAGKTTICRAIARVLRPDTGRLDVRGEVSSLLSMGTGFNQELTGAENILLNGLMLGFSKKEVLSLYKKIVEFSGIERFIDSPVKHYSSGMKSRLGFSIAAMLNPEILVLDEALSAGDAAFSAKASERMREIVAEAKSVVVVSHNLNFILEACDTAVWIDGGSVKAEGTADEVVAQYKESVPPRQNKRILTHEYEAPETEIGEHSVVEVHNLTVRFTVNKKPFEALKDVSFSVKSGEIVGIIGHNGAGKTTLCRALSRIYRPDSGEVKLYHQVSALLSMGTGFNTMLNADDNILLNGMFLGMSKSKMESLKDSIIEFAELEKHCHKPVKNYSSGMRSRLAFSIAVAVKPGLLLVDEALSAGDLSFTQKAAEAMAEMIRQAEAVIVVSHNLKFIESVCSRAIWLDHGRLKFDGEPATAVQLYQERGKNMKQGKNQRYKGSINENSDRRHTGFVD
jgi:teichoic acid transport system ATP-binding protein